MKAVGELLSLPFLFSLNIFNAINDIFGSMAMLGALVRKTG